MPPKKKKVVANGFTMYMLEMQKEILGQQGRRVPIPQLVEVANPQWKALPPEQKAFYNEEAKRYKKEQKNAPSQTQSSGSLRPLDNRRDITGKTVSSRYVVRDHLNERRQEERQLLLQSWSSGQDIRKTKFYFIAFQTLCVLPDNKGYLPCELACIEYTMAHGIKKTFHRFLKPGPIPMGYRYMCQSNSESTHQIPVEGHESATGNYQKVWQDLVAFVNPENQRVTPTLFCESRMRDLVVWSLDWLSRNANISNSLRKVMDVELLLTELYCHAEEVAHSWSMFSSMLEDSKWDHMRDTRCDYHEDLDVAIHKCALGITKKYCFHVSDPVACDIYGVTLTNKHLPESSELDGMAAIVYPRATPQPSLPSSGHQNRPQEHQPPVARIYRSQQRSQEIDDQPIRRPTTDFTTTQSQQNTYYASTDPEAPSPSAVPMPNFQWQAQANSNPYGSSNGVDDLSHHLQSTSISAGRGSQPFPGIGRGLGRGMPSNTQQTTAAMGLGRGIGRGMGRGVSV